MTLNDISNELGKLFNSAKSSVSNFVQQPIRIAQQGIQNWATANPQQAIKIINAPRQISQNYLNTYQKVQPFIPMTPPINTPQKIGQNYNNIRNIINTNARDIAGMGFWPEDKAQWNKMDIGQKGAELANSLMSSQIGIGSPSIPKFAPNIKGAITGGGLMAALNYGATPPSQRNLAKSVLNPSTALSTIIGTITGEPNNPDVESYTNALKDNNFEKAQSVIDKLPDTSELKPKLQEHFNSIIEKNVQPPVEGGIGGTPPFSPTENTVGGGQVINGSTKPQLTKSEARQTANQLLNPNTPPVGEKTLGVVKTMQESPQTTAALKEILSGGYNPKSNPESFAQAQKIIATDPEGAYHYAVSTHDAPANATAILLGKQYEAEGQPQKAADLMIEKAKQALKAGQGNQIYANLDKLSPETVAMTAQKTIEQYNQTAKKQIPGLTGEQYQNFFDQAQAIQQLPEGSRDRNFAIQKLRSDIGRLIPSSTGDKVFALWRTGLLTGLRTPGKILISHAVSNLTEGATRVAAAPFDVGMSLFTGERSGTPTTQGLFSGLKQGSAAAIDNLVHGYETPGSGGMQKDFTNQTHFGDSWAGSWYYLWVALTLCLCILKYIIKTRLIHEN